MASLEGGSRLSTSPTSGPWLGPVPACRPRSSGKCSGSSSHSPGRKLHKAVWDSDGAKVEKLVCEKGAHLESFNDLGQTPLFVATYTKDYDMTKLLLELGADPNMRCEGGYTAVHGACFSGSKRILTRILEAGGDLDAHDCWMQTPIDWVYDQADPQKQNKVLDILESLRKWSVNLDDYASPHKRHSRRDNDSAWSLPNPVLVSRMKADKTQKPSEDYSNYSYWGPGLGEDVTDKTTDKPVLITPTPTPRSLNGTKTRIVKMPNSLREIHRTASLTKNERLLTVKSNRERSPALKTYPKYTMTDRDKAKPDVKNNLKTTGTKDGYKEGNFVLSAEEYGKRRTSKWQIDFMKPGHQHHNPLKSANWNILSKFSETEKPVSNIVQERRRFFEMQELFSGEAKEYVPTLSAPNLVANQDVFVRNEPKISRLKADVTRKGRTTAHGPANNVLNTKFLGQETFISAAPQAHNLGLGRQNLVAIPTRQAIVGGDGIQVPKTSTPTLVRKKNMSKEDKFLFPSKFNPQDSFISVTSQAQNWSQESMGDETEICHTFASNKSPEDGNVATKILNFENMDSGDDAERGFLDRYNSIEEGGDEDESGQVLGEEGAEVIRDSDDAWVGGIETGGDGWVQENCKKEWNAAEYRPETNDNENDWAETVPTPEAGPDDVAPIEQTNNDKEESPEEGNVLSGGHVDVLNEELVANAKVHVEWKSTDEGASEEIEFSLAEGIVTLQEEFVDDDVGNAHGDNNAHEKTIEPEDMYCDDDWNGDNPNTRLHLPQPSDAES